MAKKITTMYESLDVKKLKKMPGELRALLTQLQAYDFTHVARKCKEEYPNLDLDELLTEGIEELRRYYALRLIYGDQYHVGVPVKLDPMVHIHVLYTKEYRKFCAYFFEEFFEHWPCDRTSQEHMEWLGDLYKETCKRYDDTFSNRSPWWPDLVGSNFVADTCCGCSCAGR